MDVPNAFTPNNDGTNDTFLPVSNCDFSEYTFMIFNRWGEKLFETNNPENSWDGNHMGKLFPVGVYVYLVKYKHQDIHEMTKTGSFTLIR